MAKSYKTVCLNWTDQLLHVIGSMSTYQVNRHNEFVVTPYQQGYYSEQDERTIEAIATKSAPNDEFSAGFLTACGLLLNYIVRNDPIVGVPGPVEMKATITSIEDFLNRRDN